MPYDGTEISQTNILINARNRLEKGWCQGHFELVSEDGNSVEYCIYGAVNSASSIMDTSDLSDIAAKYQGASNLQAIDIANKAVKTIQFILKEEEIDKWNDTPGRTKEEVLEMMDKAIVRSMSNE